MKIGMQKILRNGIYEEDKEGVYRIKYIGIFMKFKMIFIFFYVEKDI